MCACARHSVFRPRHGFGLHGLGRPPGGAPPSGSPVAASKKLCVAAGVRVLPRRPGARLPACMTPQQHARVQGRALPFSACASSAEPLALRCHCCGVAARPGPARRPAAVRAPNPSLVRAACPIGAGVCGQPRRVRASRGCTLARGRARRPASLWHYPPLQCAATPPSVCGPWGAARGRPSAWRRHRMRRRRRRVRVRALPGVVGADSAGWMIVLALRARVPNRQARGFLALGSPVAGPHPPLAAGFAAAAPSPSLSRLAVAIVGCQPRATTAKLALRARQVSESAKGDA